MKLNIFGFLKAFLIRGGEAIFGRVNEVTSDEITKLKGLTGNIQNQLNALEQKKTDLESLEAGTTATESDVVAGKTFVAGGQRRTGAVNTIETGNSVPSQASIDVVNGTNVVKYLFAGDHHMRPNSFVHVGFAHLASVIGLTAAKLMKGHTILGVEGTGTSDATASESDMAKGKTAYVNGQKVTGTVPEKGSSGENIGGAFEIRGNALVYKNSGDELHRAGHPTVISLDYIAYKIGLTSDKIVSGNTVLGVVGTAINPKSIIAQLSNYPATRDFNVFYVKSSTSIKKVLVGVFDRPYTSAGGASHHSTSVSGGSNGTSVVGYDSSNGTFPIINITDSYNLLSTLPNFTVSIDTEGVISGKEKNLVYFRGLFSPNEMYLLSAAIFGGYSYNNNNYMKRQSFISLILTY